MLDLGNSIEELTAWMRREVGGLGDTRAAADACQRAGGWIGAYEMDAVALRRRVAADSEQQWN